MSKSKLPPFLRSALTKFPTFLILSTAAAYASPTITVISPKTGTTAGAPVFYEAYAISPDCAAGIAAMRIYTAPGVDALTVSGAHIEQFLTLDPGTYSTVVQASDNCGGVSESKVDLTVHSAAGVSVYLPNQSSLNWPVHVAASAESPSCSEGIAALRIYTSDVVSPYDIHSNTLDAYVNLVPGTYDMIVKAWDNCGHVYRSDFNVLVTAGQDAYLYGASNRQVAAFKINSDGTLNPPTFSGHAGSLAVDPGGWFVFASSQEGIYGFQINQSNGTLIEIPGSPFPLNTSLGNQAAPIILMDPSGNFLYVAYAGNGYSEEASIATYRIHRSSGNLTWTGWARSFGDPDSECYRSLQGQAVDFIGQYLYVPVSSCSASSPETYGFQTDPNHAFLNSEVAGSPYPFAGSPASTADYLYLGSAENNTSGDIFGGLIASGTGALSQLNGSPFFAGSPDWPIGPVWADWQGRFLWAWEVENQDNGLQSFALNHATGELTSSGAFLQFPDNTGIGDLVEDHTGRFVFTSTATSPGGSPPEPTVYRVVSQTISANGTLKESNTLTLPNEVGSLALARKDPN